MNSPTDYLIELISEHNSNEITLIESILDNNHDKISEMIQTNDIDLSYKNIFGVTIFDMLVKYYDQLSSNSTTLIEI